MQKRYCLLLLLLMQLAVAWSQEDRVVWAPDSLTWSDFRASVPADSPYYATINTGMSMQASATQRENELDVQITVIADMVPSQSWYRKGEVTDRILAHEQIHFDITEYHARVLQQRIDEYLKDPGAINLIQNEVDAIFMDQEALRQEMQDAYDHETDHSKNLAAQKVWDARVARLLESTMD